MTTQLDGAIAIVAGATGGIGDACARALARAGATLVLLGRSQPAVAGLAGELGAIAAPACDLSRPPLVREIIGELPVPDILVGCAGGNRPAPFLDMSDDDRPGHGRPTSSPRSRRHRRPRGAWSPIGDRARS